MLLEDSSVKREETAEADVQWSRVVERTRPAVVRMDYGLAPGEALKVRVRAANAGYMLRRWNVDCSPDHSLRGLEYTLWLQDPLSLYGANNAQLAPGYKDPRMQREIKAM